MYASQVTVLVFPIFTEGKSFLLNKSFVRFSPIFKSFATSLTVKFLNGSPRVFIASLRRIGINSNNNVFILFQKAIIYAYKKDMITINLEEIYKYLGKKKSQSHKTIESIIRYSFYNINVKKLSANYEKVFGLEFSMEFFSIRTLIEDFIDILENMES